MVESAVPCIWSNAVPDASEPLPDAIPARITIALMRASRVVPWSNEKPIMPPIDVPRYPTRVPSTLPASRPDESPDMLVITAVTSPAPCAMFDVMFPNDGPATMYPAVARNAFCVGRIHAGQHGAVAHHDQRMRARSHGRVRARARCRVLDRDGHVPRS